MSNSHRSKRNEFTHEPITGEHPEADRFHGIRSDDSSEINDDQGAQKNKMLAKLKNGAGDLVEKISKPRVAVAVAAAGVGLLGVGYLARKYLRNGKGRTKSVTKMIPDLAKVAKPIKKLKKKITAKPRLKSKARSAGRTSLRA